MIDATAPFWKFWEAHSGSGPEKRIRAFREQVIRENPALFSDGVIGRDPTIPDELDARLPEWLASLDQRIAIMRKLQRSVQHDLGRFDASFRRAFPDMSWQGNVYFTVSIDAFDGALRRVDGQLALLFGIDKIALIHGEDANLSALFHHELFHLHHRALCALPEPKPEGPNGLWPALWSEGLAVWVSHHLNPDATLRQLTLSEEMVAAVDAKLPALSRELSTLLDDAREVDHRDYFLGAGQREDVPKRSGYYVGYLVAKSLAEKSSFERVVRLCGPELREAIGRELARMSAAGG